MNWPFESINQPHQIIAQQNKEWHIKLQVMNS